MLPLIALLAALSAPADAGSVYVNGVQADGLRDFEFKNVKGVRVDAQGNVWIDAPQYKIEVEDTPADVATGQRTKGITNGMWWLVTEDNASVGQSVDILVNGEKVKTIKSGDPQIIYDLAPHMYTGTNVIAFASKPGTYSGGALFFYVGTGSNEGGTVNLDAPTVTYGRRSSDDARGENKSFQVVVK